MKLRPPIRVTWLCAAVGLGLLGACQSIPPSWPVRLYALDTVPPLQRANCPVSYAVRAVRLPGYLNRKELITGRDGGELLASPAQIWAAPLSSEISRTMTLLMMSRWLGSQPVAAPWTRGNTPRLSLILDVDRLEPMGDQLRAVFRWELQGPADGNRGTVRYDAGVFDTDLAVVNGHAGDLVRGMNLVLGRLADHLADRASQPGALASACRTGD